MRQFFQKGLDSLLLGRIVNMKKITVLVTCFFLTLSIATESYAAKGPKFKIKCSICKEISEFVKTKLTDGMDFIQTKVSNVINWFDEKFGWDIMGRQIGIQSGKRLGIACNKYELCCSESLDNFCKDLSE